MTSHYHMKRVEQEKDLLVEQNNKLTEDLNLKATQLLSLKKENVRKSKEQQDLYRIDFEGWKEKLNKR